MARPIVANTELLALAEAGEIEGTEQQDLEGLNDEGGQRKLHHLKSNKLYVRGTARGPKTPVSKEEAEAHIAALKAAQEQG